MANEPVKGSNIICAIKPDLDVNGQMVPVRVTADDAYTPPRLIVELPDRVLRALGVVTIGAGTSAIGTVQSPVVTHASSNGTPITTATDTTAISAPAAGNHLRIHRLHATNAGATSTYVYWRSSATGTKMFPMFLAQNAVVSLKLDGSWDLTTAQALVITTSATGSVEWTASYQTVAD